MAREPRPVLAVLGAPRVEVRIGPADAMAYELFAGEYLQIEDIQGCQVSDFLPFHRDRPEHGLSTAVTRALVDGLFPVPAQHLFHADGGELLELVEDTVGPTTRSGSPATASTTRRSGTRSTATAQTTSTASSGATATRPDGSGSRSTSSSTRASAPTAA